MPYEFVLLSFRLNLSGVEVMRVRSESILSELPSFRVQAELSQCILSNLAASGYLVCILRDFRHPELKLSGFGPFWVM
jgi:hypothetical protein